MTAVMSGGQGHFGAARRTDPGKRATGRLSIGRVDADVRDTGAQFFQPVESRVSDGQMDALDTGSAVARAAQKHGVHGFRPEVDPPDTDDPVVGLRGSGCHRRQRRGGKPRPQPGDDGDQG